MNSNFTILYSGSLACSRPVFFILCFGLLFFQLAAQGRNTVAGCALQEDSVSLAGVRQVDFVADLDSMPDMCKILRDSITRIYSKFLPQQTLPLAHMTCDTCRELYGVESKEYMEALDMLGTIYAYSGNIGKALEYRLETIIIFQKLGSNENSIDYAQLENGLGALYGQIGNTQRSVEILEENHNRLLKMGADTSLTFSNNCSLLGTVYSSTAQYKKAFSMFSQSESYFMRKNDTLSFYYASTLVNMGFAYLSYGNFDKAEYYTRCAVNLYNEIGLDNHPHCLMAKSYLAMIYCKLQLNERGIELLKNDIERIGKNPASVLSNAIALSVYSTLLLQNGYFERADSLNLSVLFILEKTVGINSQAYLITLGNLGASYFYQNKIEKSIELFSKVVQGLKGQNTDLLPLYGFLVMANKKARKNDEVRHIISEALSTLKTDTYLSGSDVQQFLAKSIVSLNEFIDTALLRQCANLYFPAIAEFTYQNFPLLTEKDKLLFLEKQMIGVRAVMSRLFFSPLRDDPSTACYFYNTTLALKGILLDDMTRSCDAIVARGDAELQSTYTEWKGNRQVLTKQYGLDSLKRQFTHDFLDSLRRRTDELEISLMRHSTPLRQVLQVTDWQDVRDQLAADEAAVEFVQLRFPHDGFQFSDSVLYCALVLRKGWEAPRLVWLFEEDALRRLLTVEGGSELSKFDYAYLSKEKRLYHLIWKPLEPFLADVRRVFYAPDGLLHRVAFPGVGCPDRLLLCERYDLQPVGSTRDILSLTDTAIASADQPGTALLLGGINYDAADDCLAGNQQPGESVSDPDPGRGRKKNAPLGALPGSLIEVCSLDIFLRSKGLISTLLTGCAASEDNLKRSLSRAPSPRFLHISTHGMADSVPKIVTFIGIESQFPDNHLHYASLAFAGYNRKASDDVPLPGVADGEMYASEFRGYDLSNTELVTLSACVSSVGATPGGEGMFGLQRAFRLAGARHVIATVYEVNDAATAEFMKYLYEYLLTGTSVRNAWLLTQARMRQHPEYSHPYYWAGFVLL